jgi:ATP adenylyltransferase
VTSPEPGAFGSAGPADIDVSGAVGVPDSFDRIWAPHRMSYINGEGKPAGDPADPLVCPFCVIPGKTDEAGLIVARGSLVYAVLNLYPYNAGHLMIVPFRHLADITELTVAEAAELMLFTQRAVATLRAATTVQGFNLGMNLGAAGGAGIAAHLHHHVVPRWAGDLNFMPIIGRTKVLPQLLGDTRRILAAAWPT